MEKIWSQTREYQTISYAWWTKVFLKKFKEERNKKNDDGSGGGTDGEWIKTERKWLGISMAMEY